MASANQRWTSRQNGIANMQLSECEIPKPGKNEVLVKIIAVALNYRDTEVVMGLYNHHQSSSQNPPETVPCADMCGVIAEVGTDLDCQWKEGDRVLSIFNQEHLTGTVKPEHMLSGLGLPLPGVLTKYRVFPSYGLVKCPDYLTDEEASTLPIAGVTAWMAINGMRPLGQPGGAGENILIQGTGGVSISGLQIAAASGAVPIVTSSSDAKLERAKKMGAVHTINYSTNPQWHEETMRLTDDHGADIIFEMGGAKTLRKSFDCVSFGGLIDCIGYLSGKEDGEEDRLHTNVLALRRNVTLKGILNGPRDRFEEMCGFFDKHQIHPVVDRVFEMEQAKEALEYLFSGGHFGKVVVRVSK